MSKEAAEAGDKGHRALEASMTGKHEDTHDKFMDDFRAGFPSGRGKEQYQPRPEHERAEASKNLMPLEKWVDDSKRCGGVNQDNLSAKLLQFATKTDDMWQKKEAKGDIAGVTKDEVLTYKRFDKMFDLLDETHQAELAKKLPWRFAPGE